MSVKKSIQINMRGVFTLKEPFHADANFEYRVESIRTFDELRGLRIDPFFEYYNKNGLDRDTYQRDINNDELIVTLLSDRVDPIYVPTSFMVSLPATDSVPYSHLVLGVSLGLLPNTFDTSNLEDLVSSLVTEYTGIVSRVEVVKTPTTGIVTPTQHRLIKTARQSAITNRNTIYSRWLTAVSELAEARQHIAALEQYLIDNQ